MTYRKENGRFGSEIGASKEIISNEVQGVIFLKSQL
jgi:hypothetical protein